jgi:amino acid transporter
MAVSVGFSAHMVSLLDWFGLHPDPRWISPAYLPSGLSDLQGNSLYAPGWHFGFNWPAFIIVMLLTVILVRGIKESARTNNIMVFLKIVAILVFVTFASKLIHPANYHRPEWLARHFDGRFHRFFHLHWIRFSIHRGGGMQESAARPADRHHRDAGHLYVAIYRRCSRAHGFGSLGHAGG